jgi:FlgD Ig-like domain
MALLAALAGMDAHAQPGTSTRRDSVRTGKDTSDIPLPGQFQLPDSVRDLEIFMMRLSPLTRLWARIRRDSLLLNLYLDSLDNTPQAIMKRNLAFNPMDWMPTAADRARREEDIQRSQDWGNVYKNIPRAGVSIPLKSIGQALGLVEDVSPRIHYVLMRTEEVSVRVYDLESKLVAVLVNGVQPPGEYSFDWDFRDSNGLRVHYGDYIVEVIAERTRLLLRKRVEVP